MKRIAINTTIISTSVLLSSFLLLYILFVWPVGSDAFANLILRNMTVVQPAQGQTALARGRLVIPDDKVAQLKRGEYVAVTGHQLVGLKSRPPDFFIVTVVPEDLMGIDLDEQFFLMRKFTDAAIRLKADVIVDASIGDHLHTYPAGLEMAEELRANNIRRLVVFDGGHHIAGLPLEPDALLVPVTDWRNERFLDHAFTRDAVRISTLQSVMSREGIDSYIALFPRLGIAVKNPSAMAGLAKQAILSANGKGIRPTSKPISVNKVAGRSVEKNGAIFASVEVPGEETPNLAAERAKNLINRAARESQPRRVYLGITYGVSQFFWTNSPPVDKESAMVKELKANVPLLDVLSKPFSGRDIYARKVFGRD